MIKVRRMGNYEKEIDRMVRNHRLALKEIERDCRILDCIRSVNGGKYKSVDSRSEIICYLKDHPMFRFSDVLAHCLNLAKQGRWMPWGEY